MWMSAVQMLLQVPRVSITMLPFYLENVYEQIMRIVLLEEGLDVESISGRDDLSHGYDLLKELDPVAANRVHPNNHRKVRFTSRTLDRS